MGMTDYHCCNNQPAGSSASERPQVVDTMAKFQTVLAALTKQTSASMAVLRNYRRANNGEVRNDI